MTNFPNKLRGKPIRILGLFLLVTNLSFAQVGSRKLEGSVVDKETGEPLKGATVELLGNSRSRVLTDNSGKFILNVVNTDTLLVSYIGFQSQKIAVRRRESINIQLVNDPTGLDDVVVVGYGSVRRGDLTGSVGQVNMKDFEKAPVPSFGDALAGRIAGVVVSSPDGQPGTDVNIVIRGASSLTQSTAPLYVIDGFPIENPSPGSINPSDIKSITILKDASSTAIYGARAANGVVVIETKRGKQGRSEFSIYSQYGFQVEQKRIEVMSPYEFVKYAFELNPTSTTNTYLANGQTLESYRDSVGINWQDQVMRNGTMNIHTLALRGGNASTKYSFSGSVLDQKGVIINSGFRRYQGRLTVDHNVFKKLKFGVNTNFSNTLSYGERIADAQSSSISSSTWFRVWGFRPVAGNGANLIDEDADPADGGTDGNRLNPRITLENNAIERFNSNLTTSAFFTYDFSSKLRLKILGAIDTRRFTDKSFFNTKTPQGSPFTPNNIRGVNGNIRFRDLNTWTNENTLTYSDKVGTKHSYNILLGTTIQEANTEGFGFSSEQLPNEQLGIYSLDQGIPYAPIATQSSNGLFSLFSRINYNYDSRYLFTFTYRADASSKFSNPWGYFPSAAVAWNIHNESFFKPVQLISQLKLRTSYGLSGNNRVGDFARLAILNVSTNGYSFNNEPPQSAVVPTSIANDALKWETSKQIDIGIDLGLFKNKVEITADYYNKVTNDLLLNADLAPSIGFSSAIRNVGSIRNDGFEFTVSATIMTKKNFTLASSFNISFNRNRILALNEGQSNLASRVSFESQFSAPLYVSEVGRSAGLFYGLIYDGLYQLSDFENPAPDVYILKKGIPTNGSPRQNIRPGDIKYRDINNDGVVDNFDLTVIGRGLPIHTGGWSNNFQYKNWGLNVFCQWSYGNDIYNANRIPLEGNSNGRQNLNQFASYIDRWSLDNQDAEHYRTGGQGPVGRHSSRVLEDGSFLRIKTVALTYNLSRAVIEKLKVAGVTFSLSAQNLLTFTRYSGLDPEVSTRNSVLTPGFDYSAYPNVRTVVAGVNINF